MKKYLFLSLFAAIMLTSCADKSDRNFTCVDEYSNTANFFLSENCLVIEYDSIKKSYLGYRDNFWSDYDFRQYNSGLKMHITSTHIITVDGKQQRHVYKIKQQSSKK